jgi:hypothetical protein
MLVHIANTRKAVRGLHRDANAPGGASSFIDTAEGDALSKDNLAVEQWNFSAIARNGSSTDILSGSAENQAIS